MLDLEITPIFCPLDGVTHVNQMTERIEQKKRTCEMECSAFFTPKKANNRAAAASRNMRDFGGQEGGKLNRLVGKSCGSA